MFTNNDDEIVVSPVVQHVLDLIEDRIERQNEPHLTVIAFPESPNPPVIAPTDIEAYLATDRNRWLLMKEGEPDFGTRRITGGMCFLGNRNVNSGFYQEINKYGVIYHREACRLEEEDEQEYLDGRFIAAHVQEYIKATSQFYADNQLDGDIAVEVRLCGVNDRILRLRDRSPYARVPSIQSEVSASIRLPSDHVINQDGYIALFKELFWVFNVESHEWTEFKAWFTSSFPSP